ncbi:cytochrome c biogenesis protein CcsA [Sulfurimonas sp. SAG-AH-194-I05]|nr:cytochrome c biogenesis protein CcsA [Sulfurimonas sp. SAG-AH-194-I05]MDF1874364.1 cytochrome c biogenesis protein CcsA [Sulfurimonas sp. SAG-AH-194-I05]
MKQLLSLFDSMKTMAILMLLFAFAIGYATFIENDYGTITSKAEIFNTKWFEVLLGLLTLNLMLNIYKHKMFSLNKAPIFIFHIAFIVIIIGAAITRYYGYEGSMHIREGDTVKTMTSSYTYFTVDAKSGTKNTIDSQILYLSKKSTNNLSVSLEVDSKQVDVELIDYIPDAMEKMVVDNAHGISVADMMVTGGGKGRPVALKEGTYYDTGSVILDFNTGKDFDTPVIHIYKKDGALFLDHKMVLKYLKMDDRSDGDLLANVSEPFAKRTLFTVGESSFVLKNYLPHASMKIVTNPKAKPMNPGIDALKFKITVDGVSKETMLYGQPGTLAKEQHNAINGVDVHISYGAKELELPFGIHLKDFELERYPGSMSPASYASEVTLIDEEEGLTMPYRIFMNNVLEHRGYRFFQASYDQDELGTVLSVNNDPGTLPSYIGYALLALGMFWSLFSRKNRFSKLAAKAKKANEKKMLSFLLAFGLLSTFTPSHAEDLHPEIKTIISFDKDHAKKFGELIVQDSKGRMKPMDTLTTEVLAKLYGSAKLKVGKYSLTSNQVVLGMMISPESYKYIKIIKTKNKDINKLIGAPEDAKYVSFSQFFQDPTGIRGYKLGQVIENAARKEAKHRDKFDKALLKIDEKVNVSYMIFTGSLIKIWPKPNDNTNKWHPTIEALQTFEAEVGERVRTTAVEYFTSIDDSLISGNWDAPTKALSKIATFQHEFGSAVYPTESRIKAEVFYNEVRIFERIYPMYLLMGFILLILSFVKILKPSFKMDLVTKASLWFLIFLFIAHTVGLINRWYISGHAPWSNGYESMIYIGWATVLAGFIFSKRSSMTLASTAILAGLILFVAHLSWMNPQVTNLVPVLNSYWLSIHVSMITASYGFLGLGALLGFVSIILFILKTTKNEKHLSLSIKELNAINEMSIMAGLVLLSVGNFLGGVWANESWGRYWGWDPKETWALVTILIYAVILHLRFIPSLYTQFNFAVVSTLGYTSVIMTYFGVNYYLAGLHSYAKGDPVPIPDFVPITYAILFLVIALAFRNRKLS